MKRLLCAALLLAAALALAAPGATVAQAPTEVPAPWALMSVSRDQRTLFVRYVSGGCRYGAHATISETPRMVTVQVSQFTRSGPGTVCPNYVSVSLLAVRLSAPVRGRRLAGNQCPVGASAGCPPPGPIEVVRGSDVLRQVPRLIGLRPAEARRALRRQGFAVRLRGRGHMVVGERPRPGRELGQLVRRPVVLVRGRRRG